MKIPHDACVRYVTESTTYAALAAKYGCSVEAIKKRAKKEKWREKRVLYWREREAEILRRKGEMLTDRLNIARGMVAKGLFGLDQVAVPPPSLNLKLLKDGLDLEESVIDELFADVQKGLRRAGVAKEDLGFPVVAIDLFEPKDVPIDAAPSEAAATAGAVPASLPPAADCRVSLPRNVLLPPDAPPRSPRPDGLVSLPRRILHM